METTLLRTTEVGTSETIRLPHRRVRVNITCEGTLLALSESGAVVCVPRAQSPDAQTTLAIEDAADTLYLPARVVSSVPHIVDAHDTEYCVALEFLALPFDMAAAVHRLLHQN